jgi:hypothetical protein
MANFQQHLDSDQGPRTLPTAVKHLLEALECFHTQLSFRPNSAEAEELKALAQLQTMICTTVNQLRPVEAIGASAIIFGNRK